jgi:hypothetical protein
LTATAKRSVGNWFAQTNNESAYSSGCRCYNLEAHETHGVREERRKRLAEARKKRWSQKALGGTHSGISPAFNRSITFVDVETESLA